MLWIDTACMILVSITTAPPHSNIITIRINMLFTTPVEILFLTILVITLLTRLDAMVHFTLPALELGESLFHLVSLTKEIIALLFKLHQSIALLFQLVSQLLIILCKFILNFFCLQTKYHFLPIHSLLLISKNSQFFLMCIDLLYELSLLFIEVQFFSLEKCYEFFLAVVFILIFLLQLFGIGNGVNTLI